MKRIFKTILILVSCAYLASCAQPLSSDEESTSTWYKLENSSGHDVVITFYCDDASTIKDAFFLADGETSGKLDIVHYGTKFNIFGDFQYFGKISSSSTNEEILEYISTLSPDQKCLYDWVGITTGKTWTLATIWEGSTVFNIGDYSFTIYNVSPVDEKGEIVEYISLEETK